VPTGAVWRNAEYAKVLKMLGNGRLDAYCYDGVKRLCHIRGKMRKKVWVGVGDIILIGLREYQDSKADVMLKYTPDEARNLKIYGELPDTAKIGVDTGGEPLEDAFGDEEDAFEFDVDDVRAHRWGVATSRCSPCVACRFELPVLFVSVLLSLSCQCGRISRGTVNSVLQQVQITLRMQIQASISSRANAESACARFDSVRPAAHA